jgi:ribosomal protein S18 acetylase RimI-like enzyme
MLIRPISEDDIPVCADIIASAPVWKRYGVTVETAANRLTNAIQTDAIILVADDDTGRAIGLVWVVLRGAFDISCYIRWLAVASTLRGGGIGEKLLIAAEERSQTISRDLFLLCADFNVDAQRFYERHGYSRVGALENYVIPGVAEIIYRKRL